MLRHACPRPPLLPLPRLVQLLVLTPLLHLAACSNLPAPSAENAATHGKPVDLAVTAGIQAAFVGIGPDGKAFARAITRNPTCPPIEIDGRQNQMQLRVAAGSMPQRPTASAPADSNPADFPVTTCEAIVPGDARSASIAGQALALPKAEPKRIIVLADTGCRLKKSDNAWQACNDASAWPLTRLAATAASFKPDLVMHIGDYHYRENKCPPDIAGCQNSPWGYGWDTWQADLFQPAASLLRAAPWVFVRGNHEECARGGQGWMRFLDPFPYGAQRTCNEAANDEAANYSAPYAVSLGNATQIIVFDSARTGKAALKTTDSQFQIYQRQFGEVAALAKKPGVSATFFTNHHPILGFAPIAGSTPAPGNLALLSVLEATHARAYYPDGISLALHGHVHDFQAISFASNHPATIVSGNGGDNLDVALPDPLPAGVVPAPGTAIDKISHYNSFGFLLMEPHATRGEWSVKAYSVDGKLLATCLQSGKKLNCDKQGLITP